MVIDHLHTHFVHQLIKALCRGTLEPGVSIAAAADAVDNVAAFAILIDHSLHGGNVVLAVAVDRDRDITAVLCFHHTGKQRVLVAAVAALRDAEIVLVLTGKIANDVPGTVL